MEWDGNFLEGSGSVESPAESDRFGSGIEGFAGERYGCELERGQPWKYEVSAVKETTV